MEWVKCENAPQKDTKYIDDYFKRFVLLMTAFKLWIQKLKTIITRC